MNFPALDFLVHKIRAGISKNFWHSLPFSYTYPGIEIEEPVWIQCEFCGIYTLMENINIRDFATLTLPSKDSFVEKHETNTN